MSKPVLSNNVSDFADSAKGLARNPLGIIALFLVLVYGMASVVTIGGGLSVDEKRPLIYFMVLFPVLVLIIFTWLVINHSGKLFAPGDFKDETNYVRMQMSATASLVAATTKNPIPPSQAEIADIVTSVEFSTKHTSAKISSRKRILWVDDNPQNNIYEKQAFETVGLEVVIARSTDEGLAYVKHQLFDVIISDMGRKEGPREGYVFLDKLRGFGNKTPLFFLCIVESSCA